mmetsp:Transcript_49267/g.96651  ORF Transcript_49267/g.96651 Transcript_49267/m.96651 type:complete len:426 (-) Transcript_49267:62-1339(-)
MNFNFAPAHRLAKFAAPTVWHTFSPLAAECKAVNLGQGFPGWGPPQFAKEALCKATTEELEPDIGIMTNQYTRSAGHPSLVNQLAEQYSRSLQRKVDPLSEVLVCNGATETLYCILTGCLNPGDEMVTFEPAFDIYHASADMAGAKVVTCPLRIQEKAGKKEWVFDKEEFRAKFSGKTRMFLLNTPQNPTGKVMTRAELEFIASVLKDFPDVVCVADEVYEHIVYDQHQHLSIASLPGMFDRTLTVSSAGKTFSATGWKIGWAVGPAEVIRAAAIVHQWTCFSVHTPSQAAVADMLRVAEQPFEGFPSYYKWLQGTYTAKRDVLVKALQGGGVEPIMPEGSFFIIGDTSKLKIPDQHMNEDIPYDWKLCKWLTKDIGVAAIPPSSFYCKENEEMAKNFARFAFCKPEAVLEEAAIRLKKLQSHLK